MLDLTQLETARSQSETDKKLLKWASIFKAETLEELEQVRADKAAKRGGFEKKIFLKEVQEDC